MQQIYKYDKFRQLLSYNFSMGNNECFSCFGISLNAIEKIAPFLLDEQSHNRDDIIYKKLYDTFQSERFKIYKGFTVDKIAKKEHLEIVYNAYVNQSKLYIEYKKGWGCYPCDEDVEGGAICSDDGLTHVIRVGKSTGIKPILLSINLGAYGGKQFSFSGIKEVREIL